LTKADAQRVLDLLIARDAGTYTPPDTAATFEQVAREYLVVVEPGWGPHTVRTSKGLIESALIGGKLGTRPVVELTEIELQQFLNEHVSAGASRSKLAKVLLYLRNILDHAVMKKIILANPAQSRLSAEGEIEKGGFRPIPQHGRMPAIAFCRYWRGSSRDPDSNPTWPAVRKTLRVAPR
jgi:hypothetical protein